jgi:hypothetical protein
MAMRMSAPPNPPVMPPLVVASRIEGVAGEVEVVLVAATTSWFDGPISTRSAGFHRPRSDTVGSSKIAAHIF